MDFELTGIVVTQNPDECKRIMCDLSLTQGDWVPEVH